LRIERRCAPSLRRAEMKSSRSCSPHGAIGGPSPGVCARAHVCVRAPTQLRPCMAAYCARDGASGGRCVCCGCGNIP
jgi:hypothetical protein